jgi:hypothetical protein
MALVLHFSLDLSLLSGKHQARSNTTEQRWRVTYLVSLPLSRERKHSLI